MSYSVLIGDKRIEKDQARLGNKVWPEFMQHDAVVERYWNSLYAHFLDFQFAIYDNNMLIGVGNSIPVHWTEDFSDLPPKGLDWAMEKAVNDYNAKLEPNLLVGVQILINPSAQSKGLSYLFLEKMKTCAQRKGITQLALPVRPTLKHHYPLINMEEYVKWVNEKGEPFDPWLRVHLKAGGELISVCGESMKITGKVGDWLEWTGLSFQSSGSYVLEHSLCPVKIDLSNDFGEYIEPNVWVVHQA